MTLADKLARLLRPYKQAHVAKVAGVTTMTLFNIAHGRTKAPGSPTVNRIANALGVDAGWLINDRAEWPPERLDIAADLRLETAA